jgi:hypothetical protein
MSPFDQIMGVLEASKKWGRSPQEIIRLCTDGSIIAVRLDDGIGAWVLLKDQPEPGAAVGTPAASSQSAARPADKQEFMSSKLLDALYE